METGMIKPSTVSFTAAVFLAVLLSASCTADQEVNLNSSGGGRIVFEVALAPYLTEVIDQLTMFFSFNEESFSEESSDGEFSNGELPSPGDDSFFDLAAIEEDFRSRDGVNLIRLESPNPNRLEGEFTFSDINLLMQDVKRNSAESRLIRLQRRRDFTELRVLITRETVAALLAENPSLNNPLVENYGPAANEGLSDTEYLEMMEYALGEESRRGIQESAVNLVIRVEGRILTQQGGRLINDRTVRFRIPLLPFLILREPMEYSLQYR